MCQWRRFSPRHPTPPLQVEKAPTESYADVGGLEQQIQEIKEAVELPLTHPELYEDIGIKPPKVRPGARVCHQTTSIALNPLRPCRKYCTNMYFAFA